MENAKICSRCNAQVNVGVKFCPCCGSSEFREEDPNETVLLTAEDNPYRQDANLQHSYSYQPFTGTYPAQPKKRGMKWWQILLIVVGVLAVLLIVFGIIGVMHKGGAFNNDLSYSDDYDVSSMDTEDDTFTSYTKGEIVDGWYVNEWANIKFEITDDWPQSKSDVYDSLTDTYTDCGFASVDNLIGKEFIVFYEDISRSLVEYDAEKYMEAAISNQKERCNNQGINAQFSDLRSTTIAGETYCFSKTSFESNGVVLYICARILDQRAIVFMVSSTDESEITEALNSVETVK